MKQEIKRLVKKYAKEIIDDNAAIFAGAGLSIDSGYVNWEDLLKDMAVEIGLDVKKEHDLISLTQYYVNFNCGRGSLNKKIITEFTKESKVNENHKILVSLPIKTYWTTNYDNLIEKEFENQGYNVEVIFEQEKLNSPKPNLDVIIYKMHGDIQQPHKAVITKDDYEQYDKYRQAFSTLLQGDLITKTFMFIGFSFKDPNIDYILGRVKMLLGIDRKEHYCIIRRNKLSDFENNEEEYNYNNIKQDLKIKDLKRYGIQTILIDEYSEITELLKYLKLEIKKQNIFISGAVEDYSPYSQNRAESIINKLSYKIASKGNRIISGFGLGIGSSVINGVLEYTTENKKKHIDNHLLLRPFPQNITDNDKRKMLWRIYREDMLKDAGIALFFFGNKSIQDTDNNNGYKIIDSDGMREEYEIAKSLGVKVIPVGATGSISKKFWEELMQDFDTLYPDNSDLKKIITELGNYTVDDGKLIDLIIQAIEIIQKD